MGQDGARRTNDLPVGARGDFPPGDWTDRIALIDHRKTAIARKHLTRDQTAVDWNVTSQVAETKSGIAIGRNLASAVAYANAETTETTMTEQRHVKLFRNGRNQAVRIPVEFELPGDEAIMHRDGERLVIEPVRKRGLVALLKSMKPIDESFPNVADPMPPPERVF